MSRNLRSIILAAALPLLAVSAPALPQGDAPAAIAAAQLGGTVLDVAPRITYEGAVLRVSGPDGYALTKSFDAGAPIMADLLAEVEPQFEADQVPADRERSQRKAARASLPDGQYYYEVVFTDSVGDRRVHSDTFFVEGSGLVREGSAGTTEGNAVGEAPVTRASEPQLGTEDDFVFIQDTSVDDNTLLNMDSASGTVQRAGMCNANGQLSFFASGTSNTCLAASQRKIVLNTNGNVGIGTTAPLNPLHIVAPAGFNLRLDSGTHGSHLLDQFSGALTFDSPLHADQVWIDDDAPTYSLFLQTTGVGIGTNSPQAKLHVKDGNLSIQNSTTTANFRLVGAQRQWLFQNNFSSGSFEIRDATGGVSPMLVHPGAGAQLLVLRNNRVGIGNPNPGEKLHVNGSVRATSFIPTSSRALKTAFEAVDPMEILGRLAALPVTSWRYKSEGEDERHVGPVAEDFQRLFDLGDGESIATVDADGVLMAAVKGLHQKMVEMMKTKDERIAELETRLAAVEARTDPR